MPISSSVRHGDPIADIRQSPLPGGGQQAFPTRQFQEFLDDLETVTDQLDSEKIEQSIAILQSKLTASIGALRHQHETDNAKAKQLLTSLDSLLASKIGAIRNKHEIDIGKINQSLQLDKLRTIIYSLLGRIDTADFKVISITADHTTNGNEILICNNTTPITVTLNSTPENKEELNVKRQNTGLVTVSGPADGGTSFNILSRYDNAHLIYTVEAAEFSII